MDNKNQEKIVPNDQKKKPAQNFYAQRMKGKKKGKKKTGRKTDPQELDEATSLDSSFFEPKTEASPEPKNPEPKSKQLDLKFKTKGQPGWNQNMEAAKNTPMNKQPILDHVKFNSDIFTTEFIPRAPDIVSASPLYTLQAPEIYGEMYLDLNAVVEFIQKLTTQFTSKNVTSAEAELARTMVHVHASCAFFCFAQQFQQTMMIDQAQIDFLRPMLSHHVNLDKSFADVINSSGSFNSERGKVKVKYASLQVIRLYHMALSALRNINPAFLLNAFDYTITNWITGLSPVEVYANAYFHNLPGDDHLRYPATDFLKQTWEDYTTLGVMDDQLGEQVPFPQFREMATPSGLAWSQITGDRTTNNICMIMNQIGNPNALLANLPLAGAQVAVLNADLLIDHLHEAVKLYQTALTPSNQNFFQFVPFRPLHVNKVNGRWQIATYNQGSHNTLKSHNMLRKDEVKFAYVLKFVKRFDIVDDIEMAQGKKHGKILQDGLERDIKRDEQ